MSVSKIKDDLNSQTYCNIYLTTICNFINKPNQFNSINVLYRILGQMTVNLTYTPILASWPRSLRICPGVRLQTTLIIRHISEQYLKKISLAN